MASMIQDSTAHESASFPSIAPCRARVATLLIGAVLLLA